MGGSNAGQWGAGSAFLLVLEWPGAALAQAPRPQAPGDLYQEMVKAFLPARDPLLSPFARRGHRRVSRLKNELAGEL
ncbi:hypothetical protein FAK_06360 [Desulfoferula mesophila]|uniref:Uncharacterized protein n=1 Tax=Desulfoferula mesophila TaxID=3058419 RepID=A0AAU9ENQ7_9BACT|nr:hypothetical protein FAK_06360 [Desulfoferula mesophilus]